MTMRLLVLSIVLIGTLAASSAATRSNQYDKAREAVRADCPRAPGHQYALDPGEPLKPRKLSELPPAEGYQAVFRTDEKGCLVPLLVKDRIRQSR
jgi:hypothetical protein